MGAIGYQCPELPTCKPDADRFTEHYSCVEVRDQVTGRVVYRALRPAIGFPG